MTKKNRAGYDDEEIHVLKELRDRYKEAGSKMSPELRAWHLARYANGDHTISTLSAYWATYPTGRVFGSSRDFLTNVELTDGWIKFKTCVWLPPKHVEIEERVNLADDRLSHPLDRSFSLSTLLIDIYRVEWIITHQGSSELQILLNFLKEQAD